MKLARSLLLSVTALYACAGCSRTTVVWQEAYSQARIAALPDCAVAWWSAANTDRPPLEIVPLIDEDDGPAAEATRPEELPLDDTKPVWGIRVGTLNTIGSESTWATTGFLGFYMRDPRPLSARFAYEIGLDMAGVSGNTGAAATVSAGVSFLRVDLLLGKWRKGDDKAAFYALAGAGVGTERSTWDLTGVQREERTSVFGIGFGMSGIDAKWDARFGYTAYGGTGARGGITVGLGYGF